MTQLSETIITKFNELFGAIHYATDDLKIAGAEANLNGDFTQVAAINEHCLKLQDLETNIKSILGNFEAGNKKHAIAKDKPIKVKRSKKIGGHLQVTLAGQIINEKTAADTFVAVLKKIGFEQVAKLNKIVSGILLFSKSPKIKSGYQTQIHTDDWYITTHMNNKSKKKLLEDIARELNVHIKVDIEENF
jgi:hypothetical protein